MEIDRSQVLAFRLAAQGLAARDRAPAQALASWAVQDSPPGAAPLALAARAEELDAGWLAAALAGDRREAVATYNPRTATAVVPAAEAGAWAAALLPRTEDDLRAMLGTALAEAPGWGAADAVALATGAIADALDGRTLSRDDLHARLRERLPAELLPWCEGCGSHHARRGLLVAAALRGRLCLAGRAGRQPRFARTDQWLGAAADPAGADPDAAAAELVRRYLRWFAPSTPRDLAAWAGIAPGQAQAAWAGVEQELEPVSLGGGAVGFALAGDVPRLRDAEPPAGAILLAAGDPLLLARDRERLVPDGAMRRRLWTASGQPGLVVIDGRPRATWRGRRRGSRLAVEVSAVGGKQLSRGERAAIEAQAQRLAPHRGCASARVETA